MLYLTRLKRTTNSLKTIATYYKKEEHHPHYVCRGDKVSILYNFLKVMKMRQNSSKMKIFYYQFCFLNKTHFEP